VKSKRFASYSALLFSIVVFGICFRICNVGYRPFWHDELYSVSYANLPIASLFHVLRNNNQMPLYLMLLHAWILIFGASDLAVRSLSIVFGLFGMLGFFVLLRRGLRWTSNSSLIGVAILAVNPFHIYYSIEARTYSLMFAISTLYLTALVSMYAKGDKKNLMAYAFLQALLLFTHPIAIIYCFCINTTYVFLLFILRECSWPKIRKLLVANLVTAVIFSPWVIMVIRQARLVHESFWAQLPSPVAAVKTWLSIVLFWSPQLVGSLSSSFSHIKPLIWACILIPLFLLMARGCMYAIRRKNIFELLIICSLFVYPAAVYLISLLFKPIFMNRILISSLVGLLVLIVIPEEERYSETNISTSILFSLFLLISIGLSFAVIGIDINADWRKIAAAISQRAEPQDLILVYESHGETLLKRYYRGDLQFRGVTHDFEEEMKQRELPDYDDSIHHKPFFSKDVLKRLDQLIDGRKRFFVVLSPISQNGVIMARDYFLRRFSVYEIITLNQAQILLLSSSPK